ncbi:hypothetical protein LshimejAT787_1802560 [Lyophyllum shimeji]|uniref:Uncharacterized protein n=1 Tax=Lyophyllum shimeji TaxID=47721 RepID=A0A9P3URC2_LYOSH|nr:hypothetical protein LshimejAT787_1802560 [Lyophyllum shimeji]
MADINLAFQGFIDSALSYISETLPAPLYSFLIDALSHCLALFTAICALVTSLLSTSPFEWNAQKILPPLITLFAAYLALLSFYRTTTWMLRTTVFFVKWGTIFGALIAGVALVMGNAHEHGLGNYDAMAGLGSIFLDLLRGKGRRAAARAWASGSRSHSRTSRTRGSEKRKPKPWESFEQHREWKYDETQAEEDGADAQKVIRDILGGAGKLVKESGWWNAVKGVMEGNAQADALDSDNKDGTKQHSRKSRSQTKAGGSRSR